jgi:hypothetical protein
MYYTDVYDWNAHEKNFPGINIYQKVRNTLRAGEDPNLTAEKNENYRMNFELDAKEIEKLRKSMQPPSMENGGWLDKYNDGGPVQENYNDYSVSAPKGYVGDGYSNVGRNYSPAWGGQFAMGGSMPGAVGHMYSRQGSGTAQPGDADYNAPRTGEIPDNGKYAKKTKASAQDGKTIYSGMLPEITVVGSKDPQTEEFYRTMLDRLTKEEGSNYGIMENNDIYSDPNPETFNMVFDNPISTNNILGRYQGLMDLGKKYGFPKVHPIDSNSIFAVAEKLSQDQLFDTPPANYNPLTKTIQATSSEDWVSELAHHVQFKNNPISTGFKFLTSDVPAYISGKSPYEKPGAMEYEAHSIIEPKLEEEIKKSKSKYKQLPYIQKLIEQFYGPIESYQNGGEMRYYQEGLDFKPKTISRNGSVIKDDMGQWAHPGEITEIGSNQITMQGVPYPVLGISDTGDTQMMYPNQEYQYDGSSVTEYPMAQNGRNVSYVDSVLNANKNLNWVKRLYDVNRKSIMLPGQKDPATHYMESGDGRVYPTVVEMPNGKLKHLGDKAFDYADSTNTFIQFPNDSTAQWFGKNYKQGTGVLKKKKQGGQLTKLDQLTNFTNYNTKQPGGWLDKYQD